jgi:hypothetical protein
MDNSNTLIAVTRYSHYKINNEVRIHFNKHKWLDNDLDWYNFKAYIDTFFEG